MAGTSDDIVHLRPQRGEADASWPLGESQEGVAYLYKVTRLKNPSS